MGALVPCVHFCRYEDLQLASMAPPPAHCVCHLPRLGRGGWRYAPSPYGDSPILASPVATGEVASMRADGGARGLRALLSLWMVYGLRSWRPLRHTACATSPALAGEALGYNGIIASPVATGEVASNASRWGRSWLAFISDNMKVYGLRPWRPLRHTACATSPALAGEAGGTLRPLAGIWF